MSVISISARRTLAVFIVVLSIVSYASTWAASVTLAWNPNPNPEVAGYTVYYGLASGDYSWSLDAGAYTNVTVSGLNPGLVYYFAVSCYDSAGDEGLLSSEIIDTIPFLPLIISAPANQTVIAGGTAAFTVSAVSAAPLTYQWFDGATAIPGATNATLTLPNVSDAMAGDYRVMVGSIVGSVDSGTAVLSVVDPLTIVGQPVAQNVAAGTNVWFHVVVSGTPPYTFQWYDGGTPVPTGTKATLHLTNVSDADAGNYSVVIGNRSGSVTSDEAMLSVIDPPMIVSQPVSQNVAAGASIVFNVAVSGTPPFIFQWYDGGTLIAAGTKATLRLPNVSATNAGNYSVTVQNTVGAVTSDAAALTITNTVAPPGVFVPLAGAYNGLFYQTNGNLPNITTQTAGFLGNCIVGTNGDYNASICLGGFSYPLTGALNASGSDSEVVSRAANGLSNLNVTLNLDMTGASQMIAGLVSNMDTDNPWTAPLEADLAANAQLLPAAAFVINISPAPGMMPNSPQSSAFVFGSSTATGIVTLSGYLADGTQVSQTVPVANDGTIPVYFSLYDGLGVAEGWINLNGGQPAGTMTWICPAGITAPIPFPQGFTNSLTVN